jgi:magnesium transporter
MRTDYNIEGGKLVVATGGAGTVQLYAAPTDDERAELLGACHIDQHALQSALDPEEVPRVDFEPDHTFIVWKRPCSASFRNDVIFDVSSIAFVLQRDRLTIIAADDPPALLRERTRPIRTLHDLLLREVLASAHHYQEHLRVIKSIARSLQAKLKASIGNEYLLSMFALGESLIYYISAIEANGGTLARLRGSVDHLGFTKDEIQLLDDVIIENGQCARQAAIYSEVLSGLMDARGSIINNNMNALLQNLMVINVVFLPLGVLAGVLGMSEFTMMTSEYPWWISYPLFFVALCGIGFVVWFGLRRWLDRKLGVSSTT